CEKLIRRDNHHLVSYGKPRMANESVHVGLLASTGSSVVKCLVAVILLAGIGLGVILLSRKQREI
ncbi:MAG: hypothetical protein M3036_00245, partial [Bifidobacteriales bacterium]|nr:hypothetical protein [Bifidobacteriales bacterium]